MKKRLFAALTALTALTTFAFAGCSGAGSAETTTAAQQNTETGDVDQSLQKVLDSKQLILGLDATFVPMGFTDESDQIVGFDIDVAEEVCARLGVTLVKQPIDWATKETDLEVGKIDCIWNGMSVSPSRAEVMNLSEPYMKNDMIFVVANGSDFKASSDLTGKNVAVRQGSGCCTGVLCR